MIETLLARLRSRDGEFVLNLSKPMKALVAALTILLLSSGLCSAQQKRVVLDTVDDCDRLAQNLDAMIHSYNGQAKYDSARLFLRYCYNHPDWRIGFGILTSANSDRSTDSLRFVECREFLKSILYLRTDSNWYCADVLDILSTLNYMEGRGYDDAGGLAICKYVIDHQRCDTSFFDQLYRNGVNELRVIWQDTVRDSVHNPYRQPPLPSLADLKLQILEGPQSSVAEPRGMQSALDVAVTENPFSNGTALRFSLQDYELVAWKMYDVLGNEVASNHLGVVLGPGEQMLQVPSQDLPSGTYYIRVAIRGAQPQTLKVVKR